ncbi:efflux RND transporter periplasmic adaptor subunit [Pseudanabaena sp. UWO310]|uniref:efflux RND transporter periplasmic adaptor subunit n=1 Tax=Pseudanabaena sp. UWO310 TaxID=2480795 RepID=UPI0011614E25|nr:efflux RND transporter periplasmic adaptor subunit [Pseudanabaena sp. UWO310]TYQ23955.1 efflux RND transporter periplasmic adaptor subunit [Pseudanabaena sp. UWO310]
MQKLEVLPQAATLKQQETTKLKSKTKPWLLGLFILIPMMGVGYFAYNQLVIVPQQQAKNKIQTAAVERSNLTILVSANGTVQPKQSVNVSPKTSGILKQLLVKEGDVVKAGQILAYMDDTNLQGQLLQSQGNLAAAEANLQKVIGGNRQQATAQANAKLQDSQFALRLAENDLRRNQSLNREGAISKQVFDTALTTRDRAQAQVKQDLEALDLSQAGAQQEDIDQARAQVMTAQGSLQVIQDSMDDMVLRAPFNGTIGRKFADPGAFVTPTTSGSAVTSATSSSILSLASTNEIVAQVAEANISQIRLGIEATIQVDAYSGKAFTGKVTQIATQSDVTQNVTSFQVKTSVPDPEGLLRSGMNVNVRFKAGELLNVLVVPTGAIVEQNGVQGVFVANDKGGSAFVPITVGTTVNDKTEVKSGLKGTEKVLLSFPTGTRKVSTPRGAPQ